MTETLQTYMLSNEKVPEHLQPKSVAVMCVGNRLMLDDGVAPAVYDAILQQYNIPEGVKLYDLGCLTLAMIDAVHTYDAIITVDAIEGTENPPGTILRYAPADMARKAGPTASLHELALVDLFDRAALLGYEAAGLCLGMQVENASPETITEGLTKPVFDAVPMLVRVVAGELERMGLPLEKKA